MEEKFGRRDLFKRTAWGAAASALAGSSSAVAQSSSTTTGMPTRVLGATGESIPILLTGAFGAVNMEYDNVLHRAYKEGCTYYDAAQAYGNGMYHKAIGNFIDQVGRKNIWLTSKSGMFQGNEASPPSRYNDLIEKEFDSLKTDYLDMYFLHGLKHVECLGPDYLKMADDMKKRGRTRHFGFSCHDGNVVELMNKAASLGSDAVQAIMFRYSFNSYGDLELNKAMDACVNAGIGLIAMKTQMSVPNDHEEVNTFKTEGGFTLQQAKLKAVWADERITAICSMMGNTEMLRQNVAAARAGQELAMKDVQQLRAYTVRTASMRCSGCNEICESRVDGDLRIADTLRYLMYSDSYGNNREARALYSALRSDERDFSHIDLEAATQACPQGIDIRSRLSDAARKLA
jgi:uncharacterized protein